MSWDRKPHQRGFYPNEILVFLWMTFLLRGHPSSNGLDDPSSKVIQSGAPLSPIPSRYPQEQVLSMS